MEEKELRERLLAAMRNHSEEAIQVSDYMAGHPEIGSREYESSARLVKILRRNGIETEYPFNGMGTAFIGRINPDRERRVALLAEYDALPEIGHACGHCVSGSASLLAALALNDLRKDLDFGVDIIGTPDEEITGGKCYMAEDGVFDGYDFAIMVHLAGYTTADVNFIALDGMNFKWHGVPAHAAGNPEQGRNALNAARLFLDATDMMRQHIIPQARIHGFIVNGGSASNVVPDYAEIEFITRAPKRSQLNDITAWVKKCADAAAMATRTKVEFTPVGAPFHELHVSPLNKSILEESMDTLGIPYITGDNLMTGSSDIGNVGTRCLAFHPTMTIDRPYQPHTREFAAEMTTEHGHGALINSAALMLTVVSRLYCNRDLLDRAIAEHRQYREKKQKTR